MFQMYSLGIIWVLFCLLSDRPASATNTEYSRPSQPYTQPAPPACPAPFSAKSPLLYAEVNKIFEIIEIEKSEVPKMKEGSLAFTCFDRINSVNLKFEKSGLITMDAFSFEGGHYDLASTEERIPNAKLRVIWNLLTTKVIVAFQRTDSTNMILYALDGEKYYKLTLK